MCRTRGTNYIRGTTPALAATPHIDELLLAILPAPLNLVAATALVVYNPDIKTDVVDDQKKSTRDWLSQHVNSLLISRYYSEALSSPPLCEWNLCGGTFSLINRVFPTLSLNLTKSVVTETYWLEMKGKNIWDHEKTENIKERTLFLIRPYMRE